ncbi:hypothetical protein DM02DRAFT_81630 [Periconia macrospinosa]|uniref:F-box domain-containing protein n=1 Tax=Periconia macrospinosa TaxID=97972 RepID=A0A2V1DJU7_9PLEO|nr:hypothetical protein DM02DRAFT_81630 [Periconia macrospinosa]
MSLPELPAELQLLITGFLEDPDPVPSVIPRIPVITWSQFLPNHDLINLSSCCKVLRDLIAPIIFREVRLRNNSKSGDSVQAVSNSVWATHVRTLHFECVARPEFDCEDDLRPPPDNRLYPFVDDVLANLSRFPLLKTLTIQFMFGESAFWDHDTFKKLIFQSEEGHLNGDDDPEIEKQIPFRALMMRVYDIVTNSNHATLTSLELRNFTSYGIYSWRTGSWRRFLGSLKDVSIYLHTSQNEAGWSLSRSEDYFQFVANMEPMFRQMNNVTHLRFVAADSGPLGLSGQFHGPLPLSLDHIPFLESLELEFCFINEDLAIFIVNRSNTLKRVHLKHCFSAINCVLANKRITWAKFFDTIAEGMQSVENVTLEEFLISPSDPIFDMRSEWEDFRGGIPIAGAEDSIVEWVERNMKRDKHRRLFAHADLDDELGAVYEDAEENTHAYCYGLDQRAFDRVIAMLQRNVS